jgi:hypothetical protein
MKTQSTIIMDDFEVADMFQEKTNIMLWIQGTWRCPEGHISIEYCRDSSYVHEQDRLQYVTSPTDPFNKWDEKLKKGYIQTQEEALKDINKLTKITYDHCLCFLVTYGYIPKADLYIVTNGSLSR